MLSYLILAFMGLAYILWEQKLTNTFKGSKGATVPTHRGTTTIAQKRIYTEVSTLFHPPVELKP